MQNALRHRAFKYVAALAIAGGMGLFPAGPRLLRIPERLMACGHVARAMHQRLQWPLQLLQQFEWGERAGADSDQLNRQ